MTAKPTEDDMSLPPETSEEVYQYLARSLRRKRGFGLFFVQCTPAQATDIIAKLKDDLPQKKMQELRLERDSTTLYDCVETLWQQQPFDILFVTNLEASVLAYEDTKRLSGWGDPELIYTVSWKGVPPILSHLNQQRERFRDHFDCCFVFLVPPFVIKYFIQRAPDFFDWRSGLFTFPPDEGDLQQESEKLLSDSWNDYAHLSTEARTEKLLTLRDHIDHIERNHSTTETSETSADLLCQQGLLFESGQHYGDAVASYNKALAIDPTRHKAWKKRGDALRNLRSYEDAVVSYDRAVVIKPNYYEGWYARGIALNNLGRYEEAIYSYDQAIAIKPDKESAWKNRGLALGNLKRYRDAIVSFDCAIAIKPDLPETWCARGLALGILKCYKDAIISCDHAIVIKSDYAPAWYVRGLVLRGLRRYGEAIASFDQALAIKPDLHVALENRSITLKRLEEAEATESYNEAVAVNQEYGKNQNRWSKRLVRFVRALLKAAHD